jgi:predicted nucleotidyltransferase
MRSPVRTSILPDTPEQQQAIVAWAQRTRCITEVRIFGSRVKGCARPDSDVDLAVTIVGDETGDAFSIYNVAHAAIYDRW